MNKHFDTVFALAETSPGFDDAANRSEIIQAKRELAAYAGLQAAAEALIGAWGKGNLSQPMQAIQKAVDAFSALSSLPAPGHVRKFLDLSTAHLDAEGRDHLEQGGEGMVVYPTAYGWFVYVSEPDALASYTVPQCLLDILDRARQLGCDYVLLDCDAEEDSDFRRSTRPVPSRFRKPLRSSPSPSRRWWRTLPTSVPSPALPPGTKPGRPWSPSSAIRSVSAPTGAIAGSISAPPRSPTAPGSTSSATGRSRPREASGPIVSTRRRRRLADRR